MIACAGDFRRNKAKIFEKVALSAPVCRHPFKCHSLERPHLISRWPAEIAAKQSSAICPTALQRASFLYRQLAIFRQRVLMSPALDRFARMPTRSNLVRAAMMGDARRCLPRADARLSTPMAPEGRLGFGNDGACPISQPRSYETP